MKMRAVLVLAALLPMGAVPGTVTLSSGTGSCVYERVVIDAGGNIAVTCAGKAATCTELVTGLYQEILYRAPDPGGLVFWVSQCEAGTTEAQLRAEFEPYRPKVRP